MLVLVVAAAGEATGSLAAAAAAKMEAMMIAWKDFMVVVDQVVDVVDDAMMMLPKNHVMVSNQKNYEVFCAV